MLRFGYDARMMIIRFTIVLGLMTCAFLAGQIAGMHMKAPVTKEQRQ